MKRILERIKQVFSTWQSDRVARQRAHDAAVLDATARESVQVMEFQGRLYVSVSGVPLFDIDDVKGSLTDAVTKARTNYKRWKEVLWEQSETTRGFTRS